MDRSWLQTCRVLLRVTSKPTCNQRRLHHDHDHKFCCAAQHADSAQRVPSVAPQMLFSHALEHLRLQTPFSHVAWTSAYGQSSETLFSHVRGFQSKASEDTQVRRSATSPAKFCRNAGPVSPAKSAWGAWRPHVTRMPFPPPRKWQMLDATRDPATALAQP